MGSTHVRLRIKMVPPPPPLGLDPPTPSRPPDRPPPKQHHASRRYANLIDDRAVRSFISQTHEAYWQRLRPAPDE